MKILFYLILIAILSSSCISKNKINNQDWKSSVDTIGTTSIILSYKYPIKLHKDFIQNGICFGEPTSKDEEFPNNMQLCIWINDENLENIDTIINSERRALGIINQKKENIIIDEKNALRVRYFNNKNLIIKEIIILKNKGTLYQIIAREFDSDKLEYFLNNFKIKTP